MNIDPKVEPWLRALLDGVQNSNHSAEVVATAAYDACRRAERAGASDLHTRARAALALARGETP